MPTTIGLLGRGRLAQAIAAAADGRDDVSVAWSAGRAGVPAVAAPVDVAVCVSAAAAVPEHLAWAARTGTPLVIGTTGWDLELVADPAVPVLVAPNFSLGIALVARMVRLLGGYAALAAGPVDLAVSETHHRRKVDAPSGTALALAEALAHGARRPVTDVQTPSLRLGEVIGDHEAVLATSTETISVRHTAHDRGLFADGALAAAAWLTDRTGAPRTWTLDDLAADRLAARTV